MHLAFYISSHGYGHGMRASVIGTCFSEKVTLSIKTLLPELFFKKELSRQFSYYPARFDCGCIQTDSVTVDIEKTVQTYMLIAERNEAMLGQEVAWCKKNGVTGILSDIAPFPFEVAHNAGIPSAGISNFSWEDIYEPYVQVAPEFSPCFKKIQEQYRMADLVCALTPPNPMKSFRRRITIPVVGRKGIDRRDEIFACYNIGAGKKLGLIYTGDFGMNTVQWNNLGNFGDWEFIGLYPLPGNPSNFRLFDKRDFPYQDLLASADCMITKIGYGVYAECLINGLPLVYLPRENFAEYPFLHRSVVAWGAGYCIPQKEFYNLQWGNVLEAVKTTPKPGKKDPSGAWICASEIETFFNSR